MSTSTETAPSPAAAVVGDVVRVSYPTTAGPYVLATAPVTEVTVVNGRTFVTIDAPADLAPRSQDPGKPGRYTPPANWWRHA